MLLLLAALPALFWDGAADTAPALRDAGIKQILVPQERLAAWKSVGGITVEAADLEGATKLLAPTVNYRMNEASATNAPWLVANGWKVHPPARRARYYYDVTGKQAALAAAEAFCYGANAMIKTDAAGLKPLARDAGVSARDSAARVAAAGRRHRVYRRWLGGIRRSDESDGADNLLFRVVPAPDKHLKVNVKLGTKEYPLEDAKNPSTLAHSVRSNLTDEKRSLRIYGSQVVVARLTGSGGHARLHLMNYAAANRKVDGIRVRVLGQYRQTSVAARRRRGCRTAGLQCRIRTPPSSLFRN